MFRILIVLVAIFCSRAIAEPCNSPNPNQKGNWKDDYERGNNSLAEALKVNTKEPLKSKCLQAAIEYFKRSQTDQRAPKDPTHNVLLEGVFRTDFFPGLNIAYAKFKLSENENNEEKKQTLLSETTTDFNEFINALKGEPTNNPENDKKKALSNLGDFKNGKFFVPMWKNLCQGLNTQDDLCAQSRRTLSESPSPTHQ